MEPEAQCRDLTPQMHEIKMRLENISKDTKTLIASLDQEDIDILKDLKSLSKKMTDTANMASSYHLNRLLNPYTHKCNVIFKAVQQLSSKRKGALIVIQRDNPIEDLITKGIPLYAEISTLLLDSIFHVGTPLHDGSVLIQNDIIVSAANILPLTRKTYKHVKLGTRHRAAIGLSEKSDALIFVVSEETGKQAFAYHGSLYTFQVPT
ncbi:sporulation-specific diadenylate cyclase CdaS [Paenibacillus chibensis]|uniref:sporulation-specific diadenylate cyclase CdaS n=1 Tax=Paenibacillus chibensis TaxID=59846 RepID=UPI000FD92AB5|nr:sporulation-specific diadenylate cyclase CdaS [Paenibacillus chibensis]MEC0371428.1 sporulation-specific diadenylate cyclase CdaS [Paenibacillus chibensis]